MRFFTLILLLSFVLVALISYLIIELNENIVLVDLIITEIQISLGTALIGSFAFGFFVTLVLEVINNLRAKKLKE